MPTMPSSLYHTTSLYQYVLGDKFLKLAPAVQHFHQQQGQTEWDGHVQCSAPSLVQWPLAWLVGLPIRRGRGKLRFSKNAHGNYELWTRSARFARFHMSSSLSAGAEKYRLSEALSIFRFQWELTVSAEGHLSMRLCDLFIGSWRVPAWLYPTVVTREYEDTEGRYAFFVSATTFFGTLCQYEGYLSKSV